ncbi:hypothetical protein ETAA8_70720 [Anatilimnocola aggregata]|uniref:Uncharacterized protein n=1 Tax=Anatilimnocola aggregata TaxID=2528021 RepID=A0A517YNW9_9BACT|nr:hypothetical protein ETAA8_70720 [Anatilimnocola aggregata]
MDKPRSTAAPIFAAILLLLPVLYVGSYLALVVPDGRLTMPAPGSGLMGFRCHYRLDSDIVLPTLFWPIEQIDRKVRPAAWPQEDFSFHHFR